MVGDEPDVWRGERPRCPIPPPAGWPLSGLLGVNAEESLVATPQEVGEDERAPEAERRSATVGRTERSGECRP